MTAMIFTGTEGSHILPELEADDLFVEVDEVSVTIPGASDHLLLTVTLGGGEGGGDVTGHTYIFIETAYAERLPVGKIPINQDPWDGLMSQVFFIVLFSHIQSNL